MTDSYFNKEDGLPDFILMDELTEAALYANLKLRYDRDIIYTYIGNVVVSVNPYKKITTGDEQALIKKYDGRTPFENSPHVFALADNCYRQLLSHKHNQTIIISGESGAGKTEASKIVMRYIAAVTPTSKSDDMVRIKDQLLDSNPILEAFGNAKTLRNDNSSRFGKYMIIQFNQAGFPMGGLISVYLLEKSRVVTRANDERAFHIFYQLLKGASPDELAALRLQADPSHYSYLSSSGCYDVPNMDDKVEYKLVRQAMKVLAFPDAVQQAIWQVIAAILHLGQVEFEAQGDDKSKIKNPQAVADAAAMLGCDQATLEAALLNRTVEAGGKKIVSPLKPELAMYARDALAKAVYQRTFRAIVAQINSVIENNTLGKDEISIGLLDIYGFEVFEHNSFEQFCINLVNEKLQQVFIELTLKAEQEEYEREGIEWTPVEYFNNKVICDLIEAKPQGIIAMLDESCLLASADDAAFLAKLNAACSSHAHFESFEGTQSRDVGRTEFRLKHYAGDVHYDTVGMRDKNTDQLYRDLQNAMNSSTTAMISTMFPPPQDTKRPETAGSQFRRAVSDLVETLMRCEAHYIRCIKPNDEKRSNHMHEERTCHQIRYLGLVENVRVRRAGFAYREVYERFLHRYKMVGKATWPNFAGSARDGCESLLKEHGVGAEGYRLGKTKVFLKDPRTLFMFEDKRRERMPYVATLLQRAGRGHLARAAYRRTRGASIVQKYFRMWKEKSNWVTKKQALLEARAASTLSRVFFKFLARRYFMEKVYDRFKNVKSDPKLGRMLHWSKPTAVLQPAAKMLQAIHRRWRVHTMVKSLNPAQTAEMKMKISALDQFNGHKPWSPAHRYDKTNYLLQDHPEMAAAFDKARQTPVQGQTAWGTGDSDVVCAAEVAKINSSSKPDPRVVVITNGHLIKVDMKFKLHKVAVPLARVNAIHMSPHCDQTLVVMCDPPERDIVLNLGVPTAKDDRLTHMALLIQAAAAAARGSAVALKFLEPIAYNNSRTEKKPNTPGGALNFSQDEADATDQARIVKGAKNQNSVFYPKQTPPFVNPVGHFAGLKAGGTMAKSKSIRRKK